MGEASSKGVLLSCVGDVPVLRTLVDGPIPLPAEARGWPLLLWAPEHADKIASVFGPSMLVEGGEETPARLAKDPALAGDLLALLRAYSVVMTDEGTPLRSEDATWFESAVLVGLDVAEATRRLTGASFALLTLPAPVGAPVVPEAPDAAIAAARAPFDEHYDEAIGSLVEGYLRGEGPIPDALRGATSEWFSSPAEAVVDGLSPDVERWDPKVSGRLLALWLATRPEGNTDLRISSGKEATSPELGRTRALALATALEARGADPALAVVAAHGADVGRSSHYLAATLWTRPGVLEASRTADPSLRRALGSLLVPSLGLELSAAIGAHVRTWLGRDATMFDAAALLELVGGFGDVLTPAHLDHAATTGTLVEVLKLANALAATGRPEHAEAADRGFAAWCAALGDDALSEALARGRASEPTIVAPERVWSAILDRLEKSPGASFPAERATASQMGFSKVHTALEACGKGAPATQKKRALALLEAQKDALGPFARLLDRLTKSTKVGPSPYAAATLADLDPALQKAFATVRDKSWKAGVHLPKGASKKALAAAEKTLGVSLPAEARAFYALHDGGGEDEVFRGCRLYALAEAVERRAELLTIDGAPFDRAWLPLTDDGAGNHHCLVLEGKAAGSIVDFDHEAGGGAKVAKSFVAFLTGAKWG